jgi:hypothetical protein
MCGPQNITLLRIELTSLYTTDAIRRMATETVLPFIVQWLTSIWTLVKSIHFSGKKTSPEVCSCQCPRVSL